MQLQIDLDAPIRGVPLWLLREYLEELGGIARSDDHVLGPGWQVRLTQIEPFQIGSLRVGQVCLTLSGEPDPLAALRATLGRKLMTRGGG
jgi:hypothetical protein